MTYLDNLRISPMSVLLLHNLIRKVTANHIHRLDIQFNSTSLFLSVEVEQYYCRHAYNLEAI